MARETSRVGGQKSARNRREFMERVQHEIQARLEGNHISARVMGREKHLHSIYRKMLNKELRFNQVMDIMLSCHR